MNDVVARCPDCGREHPEAFAQCDWCGRSAPSRWWCSACGDWRAAQRCPACAGGLGVPSEVRLGSCVAGGTAAFQFPARNSGKKPLTCKVASSDRAVALITSGFVIPPGRSATVSGEIAVPLEPLGGRSFRLVTFDGSSLSETLLLLDAVAAEPRLEFLSALLQLRTANPGSVVRSSLALKNTGNVPLSARLSSADAWLVAESKEVALAPGESAEVKLRAKSKKTDSGTRETTLTAATDSGAWTAVVRYALPEPELAADPVDFGELRPGHAAFADVVLRNTGRVRVNCTVGAASRWLRVTPTRVNLQPGREKTVRVRALLTPAEDGPQASELLVSSASAVVLRVPVTAVGKMPQPVLRAVRKQRLRDAIGPPVERKFQVANDGAGRLDLTATSDAPWLKIVTPTLHVVPGKKRKLRYVVDLPSLALGEHSATIKLESNGGTATVPVTVQVLDPNPVLEIVSGPNLGLVSPEKPLSASIQVRNAGIGLLRVAAESENPRNTVLPVEIDVPSGPPVKFNLTIPVDGLPGGEYEAAVRLSSNGGAGRAVARFRLPVEQIDVPALIDLGVREAGVVRWDWLRVVNTGQYPVTLNLRAGDQRVKLHRDHYRLSSLQTVMVPFYLDLPAGTLGPVTTAILVEGRAFGQLVAVRVLARKMKLVADPDLVDLGYLTSGAEREFIASIMNVGEITAEIAAVHVAGELEVWVRKATVRPGAAVTLTGRVRVNAEQIGQQLGTTVRLGHGVELRFTATVAAPIMPKILAVTAAIGGMLVGGAAVVAFGWPGVPLALLGLFLGAWLFWRGTE